MQKWFSIHKSNNAMHHINRLKTNGHVIISISAKKKFLRKVNIQKKKKKFNIHLRLKKTLNKVSIMGTYPTSYICHTR